MPIYEPGLDKLVVHNVGEGRLTFTTDVAAGVAGAEVVLLAVGTPPGPGRLGRPVVHLQGRRAGGRRR